MTADQCEALVQLVERHAGGSGWTVTRIRNSGTGSAFVALAPGRRLFLKWPTDIRPLPRLAELGVVPPIVATGRVEGSPFLLQHWSTGAAPDRSWLRTHAGDVVTLMGTYHRDQPVRDCLAPTAVVTAEGQRSVDLRNIRESYAATTAPGFREPQVRQAVLRFLGHGPPLNPLVATHGDPNPQNLLVSRFGITLIDWDGAALSDPLRDVGPLLWWFIPPNRWPDLLSRYGSGLSADPQAIQWWAARASLLVAIWLDAHSGDSPQIASFLADFLAAESGAGNPHLFDTA